MSQHRNAPRGDHRAPTAPGLSTSSRTFPASPLKFVELVATSQRIPGHIGVRGVCPSMGLPDNLPSFPHQEGIAGPPLARRTAPAPGNAGVPPAQRPRRERLRAGQRGAGDSCSVKKRFAMQKGCSERWGVGYRGVAARDGGRAGGGGERALGLRGARPAHARSVTDVTRRYRTAITGLRRGGGLPNRLDARFGQKRGQAGRSPINLQPSASGLEAERKSTRWRYGEGPTGTMF